MTDSVLHVMGVNINLSHRSMIRGHLVFFEIIYDILQISKDMKTTLLDVVSHPVE